MQVVRRLWAICISVGIVLLTAFPSALLVDTQGWYQSLTMPVFALNDEWFTPAYAVVYIIEIAALSSLFYNGVSGLSLYLPLSSGVFNIFWCYLFFRLNCLAASVAVMIVIALWSLCCTVLNAKRNKTAFVLFSIKTVWNLYLLAIMLSLKV